MHKCRNIWQFVREIHESEKCSCWAPQWCNKKALALVSGAKGSRIGHVFSFVTLAKVDKGEFSGQRKSVVVVRCVD